MACSPSRSASAFLNSTRTTDQDLERGGKLLLVDQADLESNQAAEQVALGGDHGPVLPGASVGERGGRQQCRGTPPDLALIVRLPHEEWRHTAPPRLTAQP
jgi:hypothetical protein